MFNVGGGELMVIFLVALIFLGPHRLPNAARQVGKFMAEMRRMSSGFQSELRNALDEPLDPKPRRPRSLAADPPAATATPRPVPDTPLDPEVAAAIEAEQAEPTQAPPAEPDDGLTS
jgi:Tat protein translocase TatB subunit